MPQRQFIRSRKAWYDTVKQTNDKPEEFMLSFTFQDGEAGDSSLYGEIALRYRPTVSGWRLEAYDDSLLLVSQFSDVIEALGANPTSFLVSPPPLSLRFHPCVKAGLKTGRLG